MRRTTILMGACLAVAFAVTTSASAQTQQQKPAGAAGQPVQEKPIAPPAKPKNALPGPVTGKETVAPMTEDECTTEQAGTVIIQSACLSGKACRVTGENQQVHVVCISKK